MDTTYDLFAGITITIIIIILITTSLIVCNHYGRMGYGHYTAFGITIT